MGIQGAGAPVQSRTDIIAFKVRTALNESPALLLVLDSSACISRGVGLGQKSRRRGEPNVAPVNKTEEVWLTGGERTGRALEPNRDD
jgi:hypothetical protein